jgi:hypothetical protein
MGKTSSTPFPGQPKMIHEEAVSPTYNFFRYHSVTEVPDDLALVFLVDKAVAYALEVPKIHLTFGESWCLINWVTDLATRIEAMLSKQESKFSDRALQRLRNFVHETLREYLGESTLATPKPGENRVANYGSDYFKHAYNRLPFGWDSLRSALTNDGSFEGELSELCINPVRWKLLGFSSQEDFREWFSPTTKSIERSADSLEIALLKKLLELRNTSIPKLEEEGSPTSIIVETLNRLLRDRWVRAEGEAIALSNIGAELLAQKLKGL